MKIIKYLIAGLILLVFISLASGYILVNKKLTPAPNYLEVSQEVSSVPITWEQNEASEIAALLLPVKIPASDQLFYMQFDLGAPSTLLYRRTLKSLEALEDDLSFYIDSTQHLLDFSLTLGEMTLSASRIKTIDYGAAIDLDHPAATHIIGTIGADLIEKKPVLLDFINDSCYFGNKIADAPIANALTDFSFNYRWVFLPAEINGKKRSLWYDTGSSGFSLLTSKSTCLKMARPGAVPVTYAANSWGSSLETYTLATEGMIHFENMALTLPDATYVEGYSFWQEIIARTIGVGGVIGNKIFMEKQVFIDGKNKKFGIFDYEIQQSLK